MDLLIQFLTNTGYYLVDFRNIIMLLIGSLFLYLAIAKEYEPLLLLPIGFGVLVGNIPFFKGFGLGIYEPNSVLHYLYFGVTTGVYPSIVFLGLGAMTDFSSLLAMPRLMLLGAAAQMGIYFTLLSALALGFLPKEAGSIAIIGGADGPDFHLSDRQTGTPPDRSDCYRRIFLHGAYTDYTTTDHEAPHYEGGTPDSHAGYARRLAGGKTALPGRRSDTVLLSGPGLDPTSGPVFFR